MPLSDHCLGISFVNPVTDVTTEEELALRAAIEAARLARSATVEAEETTAANVLIRACRGRGVTRPLELLWDAYLRPERALGYERALAADLGAVDGFRAP